MKDRALSILFLLFFLFSIGKGASTETSYVTVQNNVQMTDIKQTDLADINLAFYQTYFDIVITTGNVSSEELIYLFQFLDDIPINVMNHIKSNGWHIYLEDAVFSERFSGYEGYYIFGYTDYAEKIIHIHADTVSINRSVVHEIGHYVYQYMTKDILATELGIIDINHEELQKIIIHGVDNRTYICDQFDEMIAQVFVEFIYYPNELQHHSPQIYDIYYKICNSIVKF